MQKSWMGIPKKQEMRIDLNGDLHLAFCHQGKVTMETVITG